MWFHIRGGHRSCLVATYGKWENCIKNLKQCNPMLHCTGQLHCDSDTPLHGMPIHRAPAHLTYLNERTVCGICYPVHDQGAKLLSEFSEAFSKDENDLGCRNLTSHTIDAGKLNQLKKHASPVVLGPKKDNSARVCIHYRKIIENTK